MVDLQNPTSQFHSYQPPDAVPHQDTKGHWELLKKAGLNDSQIESVRNGLEQMDLRGSWDSFRDYARRNPGKVLGGMAAVAIGAGLLAVMASRRRHRMESESE